MTKITSKEVLDKVANAKRERLMNVASSHMQNIQMIKKELEKSLETLKDVEISLLKAIDDGEDEDYLNKIFAPVYDVRRNR